MNKKGMNNQIELIKDEKLKSAFNDFTIKCDIDNYDSKDRYVYYKGYYLLARELVDVKFEDFNWEVMCQFVEKYIDSIRIIINFYVYLFMKNYKVSVPKYFEECIPLLLNEKVKKRTLIKLFNTDIVPMNYYLYKRKSESVDGGLALLFFNTTNEILRNELVTYCNKREATVLREYDFFMRFEESLRPYEINCIEDFNIKTFNTQFEYYKSMKDRQSLYAVANFYLLLLCNYYEKNLITSEDGIDLNYIKRNDFVELRLEGYKLIFFNPNEPIPKEDKWVLVPNGYENTTTTINAYDYSKINFLEIVNEDMRNLAKKWFWEVNTALSSRISSILKLRDFLNFIYNYRKQSIDKKKNYIDKNTFTIKEIYSYSVYVKKYNENQATINGYFSCIRKFFSYLTTSKTINVEIGADYYLTTAAASSNDNIIIVPDEEFIKLEKRLAEQSKESYQNMLFYSIFYLTMTTEFRISQITNLSVDCVEEAMKKNQYVIKSITKVSNGDIIRQPISNYTRNHIDFILKYTENFREECKDKTMSSFMYIYKKGTHDVCRVIEPQVFNKYIKSNCKFLNIPLYTSKALRATYTTRVRKLKIEKQWSPLLEMKLTNHKSQDVINNHYINMDIRKLLEATYGVIIGDVSLKGQVITSVDADINRITNIVEDGCGRCGEDACDLTNNLGCLVCTRFYVTLKNIPYIEGKIKKTDEIIVKTEIQHDREHLYSIKKLYVAYLEALYNLKDGDEIEGK